jgi:hypothetical protein
MGNVFFTPAEADKFFAQRQLILVLAQTMLLVV